MPQLYKKKFLIFSLQIMVALYFQTTMQTKKKQTPYYQSGLRRVFVEDQYVSKKKTKTIF